MEIKTYDELLPAVLDKLIKDAPKILEFEINKEDNIHNPVISGGRYGGMFVVSFIFVDEPNDFGMTIFGDYDSDEGITFDRIMWEPDGSLLQWPREDEEVSFVDPLRK